VSKAADEPISLVPYDLAWPTKFDQERDLLNRAIGVWAVGGIHHVGSTAVPGLIAKPIIDTLIGVPSLESRGSALGHCSSHRERPRWGGIAPAV
jgi:GrpB-like predicted nucleotidyltransferase (UPF0157 family)